MSVTSFISPPVLSRRGCYAHELPDAIARGALLVDIRTQAQRNAEGALLGALAIEHQLLPQRLVPHSPHRIGYAHNHDIEWIVVCMDGAVAGAAAASLRRLGLHHATELVGGYRALRAAGLLYVAERAAHVERTAPAVAQL